MPVLRSLHASTRRAYFAAVVIFACALATPDAQAQTQAQTAVERPTIQQLANVLQQDPDNRPARWAFAQGAFNANRYDVARYHVGQLLRSAQSEGDIETLTCGLSEITAADPWDVSFNFSLLPSTNVNRYTYNNEFETLLGIFTPEGGGDEVSGIGLSVGAGLSYTIALPDYSQLSLRTRVDQRLYDVPDLNSTSVRVALSRESFAIGRTTTMEPFLRLGFDEERELERRDYGLSLSTPWQLGNGAQLRTSFMGESRNYIDSEASSGPYGRIGVNYENSIGPRMRFRFGVSVARFEPEREHLTYWESSLSANISRRFDGIGALGVFGSITARDYDGIFPATDLIREDDTVALGISYSPQQFDIFGARPKISCQVQRNASNIALYDYQTTDCRIAFEKSY
jgi:hypothetical protein